MKGLPPCYYLRIFLILSGLLLQYYVLLILITDSEHLDVGELEAL